MMEGRRKEKKSQVCRIHEARAPRGTFGSLFLAAGHFGADVALSQSSPDHTNWVWRDVICHRRRKINLI